MEGAINKISPSLLQVWQDPRKSRREESLQIAGERFFYGPDALNVT